MQFLVTSPLIPLKTQASQMALLQRFGELLGPLAVTYCVFLKGQHLIGHGQIWANQNLSNQILVWGLRVS